MDRNLLTLSLTAIINAFVVSIFWTILPLYMWDFGFDLMDIAILWSAQTLMMILFSRFFGLMADRYGKKLFILCQMFLYVIAYVYLYIFISVYGQPSLFAFVVFSACVGLGVAIGGGAFIAAVTTSLTRRYIGKATGVFLSFDAIGWTIGSFISGYVVDNFGLRTVFLISLSLILLGIPLFSMSYVESKDRSIDNQFGLGGLFRKAWSFSIPSRHGYLLRLYSIVALLNLGSSFYFLAFIIKFYVIVGTKTMYGVITGFAGLIGMATPYLVGNVSHKVGYERLLVYSLGARTIFMIYLSFSWDKSVAIIFWILPLWGVINLSIISLTTDYALEGYESEAQAIRNIVMYVFMTVGNIVGGYISRFFDFRKNLMAMSTILILGSSIYLMGLVLSFSLLRNVRKEVSNIR